MKRNYKFLGLMIHILLQQLDFSLPVLQFGDIYEYLVENHSTYTFAMMKAFTVQTAKWSFNPDGRILPLYKK